MFVILENINTRKTIVRLDDVLNVMEAIIQGHVLVETENENHIFAIQPGERLIINHKELEK